MKSAIRREHPADASDPIPGPCPNRRRHPLFSGVTATSFGTLISRVLGVLRESAAAGLLGLSQGGVMDAYVIAFRIPNLFRRLFGEGAMTASYLPVLAADLGTRPPQCLEIGEPGHDDAAGAVALVVVLGRSSLLACCGWPMAILPGMRLVLGLTAVMLPYTDLHLPGGDGQRHAANSRRISRCRRSCPRC